MQYIEGLQVITTKSIGPSNVLGARIKARAAAGSVTIARQYNDTEYNQHKAVAELLCAKFGWKYKQLIGGQDHKGNYQWIMLCPKR